MRSRAILFVAVLACAAVAQARVPADYMRLFSDEASAMPQTVSFQRALQQATPNPAYFSPSPAVCANSALPAQIVARVAVLQFAKPGASTDAAYGIRLYTRALSPAYAAQNKAFGTKLKFSVKNYRNPGVVTNPAQPGKYTQGWFYYYIVLNLGRCGTYKPAFISTLRNVIRKPLPGGSQVKLIRVINY